MRIEGGSTFYVDNNIGQNNFEPFPNREKEDQQLMEIVFGEKEFIKGIEETNEKLEMYDRKLEFSIHEKTRDVMIKVVDSNTNEVIREIPPKKIIDMIANMLERAGLLVDEFV